MEKIRKGILGKKRNDPQNIINLVNILNDFIFFFYLPAFRLKLLRTLKIKCIQAKIKMEQNCRKNKGKQWYVIDEETNQK